MKTILALLLVVLGLAACGSDPKATDHEGGGNRVPAGPSDGQIAFVWSGGFVGRNDRLDIRPDGAARLTTRTDTKRFQLTNAQLAELRAKIGAADLANVKPIKEPQGVADGFLYSIVYDGHTITWGDGGGAPPAPIGSLGSFLSGLVELNSSP